MAGGSCKCELNEDDERVKLHFPPPHFPPTDLPYKELLQPPGPATPVFRASFRGPRAPCRGNMVRQVVWCPSYRQGRRPVVSCAVSCASRDGRHRTHGPVLLRHDGSSRQMRSAPGATLPYSYIPSNTTPPLAGCYSTYAFRTKTHEILLTKPFHSVHCACQYTSPRARGGVANAGRVATVKLTPSARALWLVAPSAGCSVEPPDMLALGIAAAGSI